MSEREKERAWIPLVRATGWGLSWSRESSNERLVQPLSKRGRGLCCRRQRRWLAGGRHHRILFPRLARDSMSLNETLGVAGPFANRFPRQAARS